MKFRSILFCFLAIALVLTACSSNSSSNSGSSAGSSSSASSSPAASNDSSSNGKPKELVVAYGTKPPTLDPHMSTAAATREVARPIYEQLVALNENYEVEALLADSWTISDDRLTITFKLRQGVKFHNGKEMTSEDVVASLNRWVKLSGTGQSNFAASTFTAVDPYTVELKLDKPSSNALFALAAPTQPSVIMPKEVIESADETGVKEYIGTGPFKVDQYVQDQSLRVTKFADYAASDKPTNGLVGDKTAKVDTITYEFVTDPSTRVSGLQTGQYDVAFPLNHDNFAMVDADKNLTTYGVTDEFGTMIFNKKEGIMSNKTMRQAVLAALDLEKVLMSIYGDPFFFELDHSLALPVQTAWYGDAGKELYNQKNPERAKELLAQAGYNGEEIHLLTTRDLSALYNASIAIQRQLEDVGMNVVLDVYDWSALLEQRKDPSLWDAFFTGWPAEPVPANFVFLHSANGYAGWSNSPEIDALVESIRAAATQEEASALFAELQQEFYEYVPAIKYGNGKAFNASSSKVTGYQYFYGLLPWKLDIQ